MEIRKTDNLHFEGNFIKAKGTRRECAKVLDSIIDHPVDGVSPRQLLDTMSFDVFLGKPTGSKRAINPQVNFSSSFKSYNDGITIGSHTFSSNIKLGDGVSENARKFKEHILNVDANKRQLDGFNTTKEKVVAYLKAVILGE